MLFNSGRIVIGEEPQGSHASAETLLYLHILLLGTFKALRFKTPTTNNVGRLNQTRQLKVMIGR